MTKQQQKQDLRGSGLLILISLSGPFSLAQLVSWLLLSWLVTVLLFRTQRKSWRLESYYKKWQTKRPSCPGVLQGPAWHQNGNSILWNSCYLSNVMNELRPLCWQQDYPVVTVIVHFNMTVLSSLHGLGSHDAISMQMTGLYITSLSPTNWNLPRALPKTEQQRHLPSASRTLNPLLL